MQIPNTVRNRMRLLATQRRHLQIDLSKIRLTVSYARLLTLFWTARISQQTKTAEPRNSLTAFPAPSIKAAKKTSRLNLPHSPLVRLRPIDLSTPRWSPSQRTEQCIGFHTPLLAELRIPDTAANFPGGKQIYRQSWKRWKMQLA